MRVLVTRVSGASVRVDGEVVSSIGRGLVVFLGVSASDREENTVKVARKIANLRIFENEHGKFHFSVKDKGYPVLCISNFTLCANTEKGRRPSFEEAMAPSAAERIYEGFMGVLASEGIEIKRGVFGARMDIELKMDGPVNIVIDS